ncbi:MAG: CapA family protein, partial [Lachnospiraceae bacterium]|nr:CapA family protein [Lachnospiraceae bacterium]
MLVYYSLGNFISAQPEKSCVKGGMAAFTVSLTAEGYRVTEYDFRPLSITWEDGKYMVDLYLNP